MKTIVLIGAGAAALLAAPSLAQPRADAGMTRADFETRARAMFQRVDANRDGFVTQEEARTVQPHAPRRAGRMPAQNREARFARLDADGNGVITRAEFFQPRAGGPGAERLGRRGGAGAFGPRAFARIDADQDGRISLAEATTARLRAFERLDANRDGRVTPEERRARRAQRQSRQG